MSYLDKNISAFRTALDKTPITKLSYDRYFTLIKSEFYKRRVDNVRLETNTKHKKALKLQLPAVTPSGVFVGRRDDGLLGEHTGIFVLDLDKKDNKYLDLDILKSRLKADVNVFAVHKSVSGEGLAIYVAVLNAENNHGYDELRKLYERIYGMNLDSATSNASRLRFISYDKDIYINKNPYPISIHLPPPDRPEVHKSEDDLIVSDIEKIAAYCVRTKLDITADRNEWLSIASYLKDFSDGERLFHQFSSLYSKYDYDETSKVFDDIKKRGYDTQSKYHIHRLVKKYNGLRYKLRA